MLNFDKSHGMRLRQLIFHDTDSKGPLQRTWQSLTEYRWSPLALAWVCTCSAERRAQYWQLHPRGPLPLVPVHAPHPLPACGIRLSKIGQTPSSCQWRRFMENSQINAWREIGLIVVSMPGSASWALIIVGNL